MSKSPFEKVRSLIERRKLFEALLKEQGTIVCKCQDDAIFEFKPNITVKDELMRGYLTAVDAIPEKDTAVVGNFSVGTDRFFFQTDLRVSKDEASFKMNCDVFRLQRRATMRLAVPSSLGIYMAVTEFQGKKVYMIAQIVDVSAGGARIFFSELGSPVPTSSSGGSAPNFRTGDQFKCVLHASETRTMELKAEVKHIQQAVHFGQIVNHLGLEFIEVSPLMKNRLMAMTMDLQQRMLVGD